MTLLLTKFFAIYLLIVGFALILNPGMMHRWVKTFLKNDNFLPLGGIIALIFGAFIVTVHNVWIANWPVILTIFGWLAVLKGALFLIYSNAQKLMEPMTQIPESTFRILGIVWVALGAFFFYQGWL